MADHQFTCDVMGNFDDWSDFNVSLVDEEVEQHKIYPSESLFSSSMKLKQNPSSVWKDDLLAQNIKRDINRNSELKEKAMELKDTATQKLSNIKDKTNEKIESLNDRAELKKENIKNRIHDITTDIRNSSHDVATAMKTKEDRLQAEAEGTLEKVEDKLKSTGQKAENKIKSTGAKVDNKLKSAGATVKQEFNELTEKAEYGVEKVKETIESGWNSTKSLVKSTTNEVEKGVKDLNDKANDELHTLNKELHQGAEKVKDKLSTQKDKPDIEVIPNVTVVVEDWNKHKETTDNESWFSKLGSYIGLSSSHIKDSPKASNVTLTPKESDDSMLDMVGAEKQKIDWQTTTTAAHSGGPYPASHIPSKMRVDQGEELNHLKKFQHQGFGQIDKDKYGGKTETHGTGNENTYTGPNPPMV